MDPFDLMVAPNGARLQKTDHPAVPLTPDAIADTALSCAKAGATAIHVHVRDDLGGHSLDPARYALTLDKIRARTAMSIQISTEAAGVFDVAVQRACLQQVNATDASVSLREIARDPAAMAQTYAQAAARGISMQHILYADHEVRDLLRLFDQGVIPEQARRAIFVLGRYSADQQSAPQDLEPFLRQLGGHSLRWSVCAFGRREHACLLAALNAGARHVRIGFENNTRAPDGAIFSDNAASVAAFVKTAAAAGFYPERTPL